MRTRVVLVLGLTLTLATAQAQIKEYRTSYRSLAKKVLRGAPYSAEQVTEVLQTLADGTHINQFRPPVKMYRDSLGRTRSERLINEGDPRPQDVPVVVEINDVVAGYRYVMDPVNQVAHRSAIPPQHSGAAPSVNRAPQAADGLPRPQLGRESLGSQVIEGLVCTGEMTTTTYPVGFMGNDRPIISTRETWVSRDLRIIVLAKGKDPRMGQDTMQLKNISQEEPDASLFQPPRGYKVVYEPEDFMLIIKMP